jgi:hypothetical protein
MKRAIGAIALLLLAGLMAVPAMAGELRVTGFFDNTIHLDQNSGRTDGDVTRNGDNAFMLRERGMGVQTRSMALQANPQG